MFDEMHYKVELDNLLAARRLALSYLPQHTLTTTDSESADAMDTTPSEASAVPEVLQSPEADAPPTDMEAFADALTNDRLIKIFVGGGELPPFLVPQSILCASSGYFVKVLKEGQIEGGEAGVLCFPADDRETWKALLFWIVKSTLPHGLCAQEEYDLQLSLIKAWVLGSKYVIPAFMDEVMLKLLKLMDNSYLTLEAAQEGLLGSLPGSPLRRLVTEELVYAFHVTRRIKPHELDVMEGKVVALSSSIQAAMQNALERYQRPSKIGRMFGEFSARTGRSKVWTEFMVNSAPGGE